MRTAENTEIRLSAKACGVRLWEVAAELGINDGNFSRKLRHELPEEEKTQILEIIERLKEER